jgi:hypothetical protein
MAAYNRRTRQMHTKTVYHAEMIISLIILSEEEKKDEEDDDDEPIENLFFSILSHRILIGD